MRESVAAACREGGGNAGGSFTKRTRAKIPKAEDERKWCREQPPTVVLRMREGETCNHWMGPWAMGTILLTLVGQITSPNAHLQVQLSSPIKVHILGNGQHVNQCKPSCPAP
jgi:hypothetical protein